MKSTRLLSVDGALDLCRAHSQTTAVLQPKAAKASRARWSRAMFASNLLIQKSSFVDGVVALRQP